MDKKKKKVMLTPCPSYDIAGTEGWLEEMAGAGWLLCKDSIFGIWATFEPRDPGDTRRGPLPAGPGGRGDRLDFRQQPPGRGKGRRLPGDGLGVRHLPRGILPLPHLRPGGGRAEHRPRRPGTGAEKGRVADERAAFFPHLLAGCLPADGAGRVSADGGACCWGRPFSRYLPSPSSSRFTATCGALSTCGRCGGSSGRANPSGPPSGRGGKSAATGRSGRPTCC